MQRIFVKKCFLFTVGSVCRVKRSHLDGKRFADVDIEAGGTEVAETTVKRLLYGWFRRTGKAMGQVYQCWWRGYVEKLFFFQVRISRVLRFISICNVFTDSPW
jgi:hypothetical protein